MVRTAFSAVIAAALLAAGAVQAQPASPAQPAPPLPDDGHARCLADRHDSRVLGLILGAGIGALLGDTIGQHGGKEGGAIIGGVGGAAAGDAIGASTVHCGANQYGYYDDHGHWVPNTITAYGYYDQSGRWVATPTDQPVATPDGGEDVAVADRGREAGEPMDTRQDEDRLQAAIQGRMADGALAERRGREALRRLEDIRRMDADYRSYDGHLSDDQRRDLLTRLEAVRADVGVQTALR